MKRTKVKPKILLLLAVLMLLLASAPQPAQALPSGVKSVARRTSATFQQQVGSGWKLFLKRLSRYAMAAN